MENVQVEFKHVLFATDFSENAKFACSYAKSIAKQYGAKLTLLHVIKDEVPDFMIFDAGNERTPAGVANRLAIQKDYFEKEKDSIIENIKNEYSDEEVTVKNILVIKGKPEKMIVKTAEEQGCDIIVMAGKGRSNIEEFLMGDTVRRVITHSNLPVLVVQNEKM